jgi:Fe-S-cluster containining protein
LNERLRETGFRVRSLSEIKQPKKNECWRCGMCCCVFPDLPPFTPAEIDALPPDIQYIRKWFRKRTIPGGTNPCPFLDIRRGSCLIYEDRPRTCRDFKPGCKECLSLRGPFVEQLLYERLIGRYA